MGRISEVLDDGLILPSKAEILSMDTGERAFRMDGLESLRRLDQGEMFSLTLATLSIKSESNCILC